MAACLASIAVAISLALPAAAQAANTYVDEDRPNNGGNCLTPATACKTIAGVDGGLAKAGAGDTVFVDGGTYNESFILGAGKSLIYQEFGTRATRPRSSTVAECPRSRSPTADRRERSRA